jgi:hypothetical protein
VAWHRAIEPRTEPAPPEIADDPVVASDPAYVWLFASGETVETREGAFRFLLSARVFTYQLVGGGAARSEHSRAFAVLFRQPDAKAAFLDLLERGNDAGKLYALCGLREFEETFAFLRRIEPYRASKAEITTHYGCLTRASTVGWVASGIVGGGTGYELLHPYARSGAPLRAEEKPRGGR